MDKFKITLKNIQHIKNLDFELDLSLNTLHCIVGKNSVGKTTLIKSIQNFKETNTLDKLSRNNIIQKNSKIIYEIDGVKATFTAITDSNNRFILNSKDIELHSYTKEIDTELPIPKGKRFHIYGGDYIEQLTEKIRTSVTAMKYEDKPQELIDILKQVYNNDKFDNLEQVSYRKKEYYVLPQDNLYLREDDFSSGEYMLIQIYRLIKHKIKMIVIDEFDISLDSSAQIKFITALKKLCAKYEMNIVFTTHSLAIMKKIDEIGLNILYMTNDNGDTSIKKYSYNYIQSELFQFTGYVKIILTEDKLLCEYVEYMIINENITQKYLIVPCGGYGETKKLRDLNEQNNIFDTPHILIILDGDRKPNDSDTLDDDTYYIPFDDIELECVNLYKEKIFKDDEKINHLLSKKVSSKKEIKNQSKSVYGLLLKRDGNNKIFQLIEKSHPNCTKILKKKIISFLKP